jgi:hypothetical protein
MPLSNAFVFVSALIPGFDLPQAQIIKRLDDGLPAGALLYVRRRFIRNRATDHLPHLGPRGTAD